MQVVDTNMLRILPDKPYLYCKPEEQEEIKGLSDNTPAHWVRFIESSEKPTFKW